MRTDQFGCTDLLGWLLSKSYNITNYHTCLLQSIINCFFIPRSEKTLFVIKLINLEPKGALGLLKTPIYIYDHNLFRPGVIGN